MDPTESPGGVPRQGILLAAAVFVFVIDTSFMNVSISAVVQDLDTTVSGVQSAVAIEALVSAAFIMISSKVGDLFGRKRAYVVGMVLYAVGALAMVFAQGLAAIIVFWAVIGGLGASLYLPAMQSLIHGNYEGKARAKVFALVGASGAIAAAIGPLIGGFLTTVLSWRVGFLIEALIIAVVLLGSRGIRDVPYTGDRSIDVVGVVPLRDRHGRNRRRRPRVAGGRRVGGAAARDRCGSDGGPGVLARPPQARGKADAARSDAVRLEAVQPRGLPDLPPAGCARARC